jgi:hypothetical protein
MACLGHVASTFPPSRRDLKDGMIFLLSYAVPVGLGERKSVFLKVDLLWLGPVLFSKKLFCAAKSTPT